MEAASTDGERAFVLGLDGVPWEFIRDRTGSAELPNFDRLVDEGAVGPLESTIPATTPLAWPSIATGVRPDKHGIYGFQKLTAEYSQEMYTSADLEQPPLWEILSPAIVGNVPMTYPATPIDGKMITGMITPELDEQSTHPKSLRSELLERVPDYLIELDWQAYADDKYALVDDIREQVENRQQAMELLMESEPWELFFFVYTAPDRLQHLIWEEDVLLEHYQQLDRILGGVMEYVAAHDATLYVVSDHGFGPIEKYVAVNRILEENGLLTRTGDTSEGTARFDILPDRDTVATALQTVGIEGSDLRKLIPERVYQKMASQLSGNSLLYETDFDNTKAFVHGPGNVYVNDTERFTDGCVDPGDREEVKTAVSEALSSVVDPETGQSPLEVYDGDDLCRADADSPDLVVDKVNGYECKVDLREEIFETPVSKAGNHRSTGVFMAWGPRIRAGTSVENATVYDVAPTLLHDLGRPIPETTDGRVLEEIYAPNSSSARREPTHTRYSREQSTESTRSEYDEVHERLKGLGYLE